MAEVNTSKLPFDDLLKGIPREVLEGSFGRRSPEGLSELLLYPDLTWMLENVEKNASCSPERLGENLGLDQGDIDEIVKAYPGMAKTQRKAIVQKWIGVHEAQATVQALLEALYESDDVHVVQKICSSIPQEETDRHAPASKSVAVYGGLELPVPSVTMGPRMDPLDEDALPVHVEPYQVKTMPLTHVVIPQERRGSGDSKMFGMLASSDSPVTKRMTVVKMYPEVHTYSPIQESQAQSHAKLAITTQVGSGNDSHGNTDELVHLKKDITSLQENVASVQNQLNNTLELQQQFDALKLEVSDMKIQHTEHSDRLEQQEREIQQLHGKIEKLRDENETLKCENIELRKELSSKVEEIVKLHAELQKVKLHKANASKEELLAKAALENEMTQKEKEKRAIEEQKMNVEKQLQKMESKLREKEHRLYEVEHILQQRETELDLDQNNQQEQDQEEVDTPAIESRKAGFSGAMAAYAMHMGVPTKWKFGKELGEGSFGKVHICHDVLAGRVLAVKVVKVKSQHQTQTGSSDKLKSFKREVGVLAKLSHDRIVTYIGSEEDPEEKPGGGRTLYLFMEFMSGGSVGSHVKTNGELTELLTRKYTRQLVEGVQFLHKNNIIHRDIKGDNLLRDAHGNIKLADFGSAKMLDADICGDSGKKYLQGTVNWMAPERLRGDKLDYPQSLAGDVWSIAATVVEMLTAYPPFHGMEMMTIVFGVGNKTLLPDVIGPPRFSEDVQDFLTRCFKCEPTERPSASELLQDNLCMLT